MWVDDERSELQHNATRKAALALDLRHILLINCEDLIDNSTAKHHEHNRKISRA